MYKPIFYYSIRSNNVGENAIRESIVANIKQQIDVPVVFFDIKRDELTEERIIKQVNSDASMLMIAGGGLYVNQNSKSGFYFPCNPDFFLKIKVPIVLFGIGFNRNLQGDLFKDALKEKAKGSIQTINGLACISTVRDQNTYDILKSLHINHHKLILDPACFLSTPNLRKERRVAIQIAQHSPILGRYDGNNYFRQKNIENYARICEYLKSKRFEVIYTAFDPLEQSIALELKKLFPDLEVLNTDNIQEILQEYARCSFTIGMKMHSNILSFATGTPFISIYYDVKSQEFLKLLDYSNFGCNCFENYEDKVKGLIDELIEQNQDYSKKFVQIKEENQPIFKNEINNICEIVKANNENYIHPTLLSVLMPVYNRESLVKQSIESVLRQSFEDFEFIIYDDGSTDNTVKIIEECAEKDKRIRLIKGQKNMGGIFAKQILLDACNTKYAVWQDSDDIALSDKFKKQINFIFSNNIVFCKWLWLKQVAGTWKLDYHHQKDLCLDSMMFIVDKNIKMPNTKLWGSSSWFNEMMHKYSNWIEIPEILYHIRQHDDRVTLVKRRVKILIQEGKIQESDIQDLTYQELKDFLKNK